jgi:hypothetical protein
MLLSFNSRYLQPFALKTIVVDDFGNQIALTTDWLNDSIGNPLIDSVIVDDETFDHATRELCDD